MKPRHVPSFRDGALADHLFILDEDHFGASACAQARDSFNNLVCALREMEVRSQSCSGQMLAINRLLFRCEGLRYQEEPREEVITLTGTLLRKKGACLGLTSLYFSIADTLSLPIRPILYDGHITVCHVGFHPPRRFEVTGHGAFVSQRTTSTGYDAHNNKPLILTREQFIGLYLSNRAAFVQARSGEVGKALESLDRAIQLFPHYPGAWINRASLLVTLGSESEALRCIKRASRLRPGRTYAQSLKALAEKCTAVADTITDIGSL